MALLQSVKAGYLFLKHRGNGAGKSGLKKWRKRWVVLQKGSSFGRVRLEHYDSEERAMNGKGRTVIDLQGAVSVDDAFSKSQQHVFEITFSDYSMLCGAPSETEQREWRARLSILLFSSVCLDLSDPETLKVVPEPTEPFAVRISRTESSAAERLEGDYFLDVTSDDKITLTPAVIGQVGVEWKLRHVRNFVLLPVKGGDHVLVMETGRRSSTGLGTFQFLTSQGGYLYAYIRARTYRVPRSPCGPSHPTNLRPVGPDSAPDLPPRRKPMVLLARPVSTISQFNGHDDHDSNLPNSFSHLPTPDPTEALGEQMQSSSPPVQTDSAPTSPDDDIYYDNPQELKLRIHLPPAIHEPDKYSTIRSNAGVTPIYDSDSDREDFDEQAENDETPTDTDNKFFDPSAEEEEEEESAYEPVGAKNVFKDVGNAQ